MQNIRIKVTARNRSHRLRGGRYRLCVKCIRKRLLSKSHKQGRGNVRRIAMTSYRATITIVRVQYYITLWPGPELHTVCLLCICMNLNEPLSRFGRTYGTGQGRRSNVIRKTISTIVVQRLCTREPSESNAKRVPGA